MNDNQEKISISANQYKRCNACGSMFHPYRPYQKYCSAECRLKVFKKKYYYNIKRTVQKKCKQCSKEFLTNDSKKVYCSALCREAYQLNFIKKKKPEKRRCLICDRIFETTHWSKRYCSNECYLKAKDKRENGN